MKKNVLKMLLSMVRRICQMIYLWADGAYWILSISMALAGLALYSNPEETFLRMQELNNSGNLFRLETVFLMWGFLTLFQIPQIVHVLVGTVRRIFLRWKLKRIR